MQLNWFKRNGIFFIPVKTPGWIITILAVAYAAYTIVKINAKQHSVSDFMINAVFGLLLIGAAYSLVGYLTSKN